MSGRPPAGLTVIETHPVQYHAPVYRALQEDLGIPTTAIYGSDFSLAGYRDREFDAAFAWDTDLTSGYRSRFLSRVAAGAARDAGSVSTCGLGRALRETAPGAVLLPGYSPRFYQLAFWHARAAGVPVLFRGETTDHAVARGPAKTWLRRRALRWLYRRCARLLYVGEASHRHFRRLGCPDAKLVFAPYCVDASTFRWSEADRVPLRARAREELGAGGADVLLLFAGKLSPRKGPDLLLRAVKELASGGESRVTAVFVGDGTMRRELEELAARPPAVAARFVGFQNQSRLSCYYHAADLLVLPSLRGETWGLVVNEALHHGVPCVVSTAVGCLPDLVEPGETGAICDAGSVTSLRDAIRRARGLVGRPEIRDRCRRRVARYSVDGAAGGIATAYRAALASDREAEGLA